MPIESPTEAFMEIEAKIKNYIAENILFSKSFDYPDSASFLQEGIIDSIGVMELVSFVQSAFGIQVDQKEITPANFDSVQSLASYVRRKKGA
jgi:acyl carrier protein